MTSGLERPGGRLCFSVPRIRIDSRGADLYNDTVTTARFRRPPTSEGIHAHLVGYVNLFSGL